MAVNSLLKKQINSINSILQITKAMKLVATAKLKKTGKKIIESKIYFTEIYNVFNDIINETNDSIYKEKNINNNQKKCCWIIINSDLGLCGGYNINLNKLVLKEINNNDNIILIGSKSFSFFSSLKYKIDSFYNNLDINSYEIIQEISLELLSNFNKNKYNEIKIAYTKFINNVNFEPTIFKLLPISKNKYSSFNNNNNIITEFYPKASLILESAMPMYMNAIIFSIIVESKISEHASRRLAMENATDNANEMLDKLLLKYNRNRQSYITQEISEIISSVNCIKNK